MRKYEDMKDKLASWIDLDTYFTEKKVGDTDVDTMDIGTVSFPTGRILACDPLIELEDRPPYIQAVPPGTYPVTICVMPSERYGDRYACVKVTVSDAKPVRYDLAMVGDEDLSEEMGEGDYFGFVVPFAIELMKLSRESGIPIKIRACDTMGYGVTYPGTSLPRSVQGIIYGFRYYAEIPSEQLEWHGHNDFYKAVTNSATAWLYGCSAVNTTLLGIGERTGNTPLEAMAIEYASLRGGTGGMDLSVITEIADYFEHEMGFEIPERTPFVGKNFNVTKAGIHADGMLKDQEIYNIFDTEKILHRPARVVVDSFSGVAGIAFWINSYYSVPAEMHIDKRDPVILGIKERVDAQYAEGRTTVISDGELDAMFRELDPERHARFKKFA